jgi:hypothetical protein
MMGLCHRSGREKSSGASTQVLNSSLGENKKPAKAAAVMSPGRIDALGNAGVLPMMVKHVTTNIVTSPIPKKLNATVT